MIPDMKPLSALFPRGFNKQKAASIALKAAVMTALGLSAGLAFGPSFKYNAAFARDEQPAGASSPAPTATSGSGSFFSLDEPDREHDKERKEVETTLANIEALWNAHNLDGVMANYADDYVNNDGLDRKAVSKLTQDFWKTYPDAHSNSKTKQIRINGNYATVDSRDSAQGTTASEMKGMNSKGDLWSISEGQLYFKKVGTSWKIIGDRIDYESVKVAFGLAKQLAATFSAPEQVKSGKQYSARLEVNLPPGLFAVGSITNQPLRYPQPTPADTPRPLEAPALLERVMNANTENRNELLTATVILTSPTRDKVLGVSFLTRRLNIVPDQLEIKDDTEIAEEKADPKDKKAMAEKADKEKAKESAKETAKEPAKETTKETAKEPARETVKESSKESAKEPKGPTKESGKHAK